jgi:phosphatidylserine/phosphatidylglycerophosphate/cardiolipin synthase-like enzyme
VAWSLIEHVDWWAGQAIEASIGAHHRRRLQRVARIDQLDPPQDPSLWAAGDPRPREGNALDVLVDGAQALPRIAEALAGARSHVHIAGWHITPGFGLTRDGEAVRLRDLLGDLAERIDVRVLLWGGGAATALQAGTGCRATRARGADPWHARAVRA